MEALVTFDSTHHALRAESLLQNADFHVDILPTPRELSASCGLSLSLERSKLPAALSLLAEHGVQLRACYLVTSRDGTRQFSWYGGES